MEFERKAHLKVGDAHPSLKPEGVEINLQVEPDFYKKLMESAAYLAHDTISPFVRPVIKPSYIKQIIFNDPATILILNDGRKIVSKAHVEEFDKEKGLLMCLCKANGITHLQLKKLIDGAVDQKPKPEPEPEVLPVKEMIGNLPIGEFTEIVTDTIRLVSEVVSRSPQEELEKFWRGE